MARVAVVLGSALLALAAPAAHAAGPTPIHYAIDLDGTNAFVGIAKKGSCFKAYLSDGTHEEHATLSVWLHGCLAPDGRTLSAERGGVRLDAVLDRRSASGTVTLRDGSAHPFTALGGDRGGIVGKRFTHQGRRYRSGWVVLEDNQVRWAITRIGSGLYGDPAPPTGSGCSEITAERNLLRAQSGPLSRLSGIWELHLNRGRGPTSAQYHRLNQARSALEERIYKLDTDLYDCR